MSIVDSGLGWKCESEYLANGSNIVLGEFTALDTNPQLCRIITKLGEGPAICGYCTLLEDGVEWRGFYLASTDIEAIRFKYEDVNPSDHSEVWGTDTKNGDSNRYIIRNGVKFYYASGYSLNYSLYTDLESTINFPVVNQTFYNRDDIVNNLVLEAGLILPLQTIPVQFQNLQDTFDITVYPPLDIGGLTKPLPVNLNYCRDKYSNQNWYWDMTASEGDILFFYGWKDGVGYMVCASTSSATYIQELHEGGGTSTYTLTDTYTYAGKTVYYKYATGSWNPKPDACIPEMVTISNEPTTQQLINIAWTMIYDND